MKTFDLVVLGEVAIDVILSGVARVPTSWSDMGRTKATGIFAAGSAGYVAQVFAKLGGRTAIVGRIGNDNIGKIVLDGFRRCHVSTRYLVVDKTKNTQVSTVVQYNNGNKVSINNEILSLDPRLMDFSFVGSTKMLHVGGYLLFPEIWGKNMQRWLRLANRQNVLTSLDPQMSATGQWSSAFRGIFNLLDILFLDEAEAVRIARKKRVIDAAEALLKSGVATVVVKMGSKGCMIGGNGPLRSIKALKTKTVSTIGAGDAFDAAFVYGTLKNWSLEKAAKFANVVAAMSTTQLGCMTAIPRAAEAERIVETYYA